ncbi:esterase family protein [Pasteurella oralis]|uniref:esterase family protein n=1 Tax=Pasteurella oralis TaxID=1071947 RepID=UPI000C7B475A|nr:alpha/beta hydrolase-fold protein [Pasteurella oralis]
MHFERLSHYSGYLQREMKLNRYGHTGLPILVFPSSGGTRNEYADFGMIDACQQFIHQGAVQFFTLSSVDSESWLANWKHPHDRAQMHTAYEKYLIEEAIPFIKHHAQYFAPMMVTGCSMGGFHAVNVFLQHPDVFNKVIALSGVYDVRYFVGEYGDDPLVYRNSPSQNLWLQQDEWFLNKYREADIVICTGLGAWEQDGLPSFYQLQQAFAAKQIPAWFDTWGHDVAHDWDWWRIQMPYFLNKLNF